MKTTMDKVMNGGFWLDINDKEEKPTTKQDKTMKKLDATLHAMFDDLITITKMNVVATLTDKQKRTLAGGISMVEVALLDLETQTDTEPTQE